MHVERLEDGSSMMRQALRAATMCSKPSLSTKYLLSTDTNYSYIILESILSTELGGVYAFCMAFAPAPYFYSQFNL